MYSTKRSIHSSQSWLNGNAHSAEVEGVLQTMEGVAEVVVKGEPNSLMGHIVTARVRLTTNESLREFRTRMHTFCQGKLESYKVPVRMTLVNEA